MLHVQFLHPVNAGAETVDTAGTVRIAGERMTLGEHDAATHRNNQWVFRGVHFTAVHVGGPVRVAFDGGREAAPVECGPFAAVKIVDGSIRHGDGYRDLVAKLDEATGGWVVYSTPGEWARVTLSPAGPPAPPPDTSAARPGRPA